jgi:hypothetical protein
MDGARRYVCAGEKYKRFTGGGIMKKTIILLTVALLVSCHKLDSGIVVKKYFVAVHHENYTTFINTGKTLIPVVRTSYIPDKWHITIEGEYRKKYVKKIIQFQKVYLKK